jgi:hypothetical protein
MNNFLPHVSKFKMENMSHSWSNLLHRSKHTAPAPSIEPRFPLKVARGVKEYGVRLAGNAMTLLLNPQALVYCQAINQKSSTHAAPRGVAIESDIVSD